MRMTKALIALSAGLLVLGVGCSTNESNGGGTEPPPPATDGPWPLTGLPGYPNDSQQQIITVKIDNTPDGRPQQGIAEADLVVQQLVEGGLTRLAAMFQSTYPELAGPVRSMRLTDIGVVKPTGGTLAASGADPAVLAAIADAGIDTATEGDPGFTRDRNRSAPYNLMLNVRELASTLSDGRPPGPYLPFGEIPAEAQAQPAATVDLSWPSSRSTWQYDESSGKWQRTDLAGEGLDFTTIIALTLPVRFGAGTDAAGTGVPTLVTEGSGQGLIATGPNVYQVRWSKGAADAPWEFTVEAGEGKTKEFAVPPGRSWLALLPDQGGSATFVPPTPTS